MKVQSNGMGTQSLAMYLMSSTGILPRFDYSIFVDTGKEKKRTYEIVDWLVDWQKKNNGVPLIIVQEKNLYTDLLNKSNSTNHRFASIPAYTSNGDGSREGMLRRQCTTEYKTRQINKKIKELCGLKGKQHYPRVINYIGFSLDEIDRIGKPYIKKFTHVFPFCNYFSTHTGGKLLADKFFPEFGVTRGWLRSWLHENGYPDPGKSSCVFCPFMTNKEWIEIKKDPQEFAAASMVDNAIRDSSQQGVKRPVYLHSSCKPLSEVEFNENQKEIFSCNGICNI